MKSFFSICFYIALGATLALYMPYGRAIAGSDHALSREAENQEKSTFAADTVPDISLSADNGGYCVYDLKFKNASEEIRKSEIIRFIQRSYDVTDGWQRKYLVGLVDYVKFSHLIVAVLSNCGQDAGSVFSLNEALCDKGNNQVCHTDHALTRLSNENILAKFRDLPSGQPIEQFEKYRGRQQLSDCAVRVPLTLPNDLKEFPRFLGAIHEVQLLYRMPVLDEFVVTNNLYILFSNDCQHKETLYNLMVNLVSTHYPNLRNLLGSPDFKPDVTPYRFAELGRN